MPNISLFSFKGFNSRAFHHSLFEIKPSTSFSMLHHGTSTNDFRFPVMKFPHITRNSNTGTQFGHKIRSVNYKEASSIVEEDDENCPVDCVREFKTDEEFLMFLAKAKKSDSLVVVDFYRNSCGSCKYIEKGFTKLCKGSGDQGAPIIFLKHNVIDDVFYFKRLLMNMMSRLRWLSVYELGLSLSSSSTKMEFFWRHFQPGTRKGFSVPSENTRRLKSKRDAHLSLGVMRPEPECKKCNFMSINHFLVECTSLFYWMKRLRLFT